MVNMEKNNAKFSIPQDEVDKYFDDMNKDFEKNPQNYPLEAEVIHEDLD